MLYIIRVTSYMWCRYRSSLVFAAGASTSFEDYQLELWGVFLTIVHSSLFGCEYRWNIGPSWIEWICLIIITWHLYLNMLCKLGGAGPLHIGRTHDQHLEACCRGISACQAGDNPKLSSSHWHCCQYLNSAKVKLRLTDLHNDDSRCRTAGCSLTSYTGQYW